MAFEENLGVISHLLTGRQAAYRHVENEMESVLDQLKAFGKPDDIDQKGSAGIAKVFADALPNLRTLASRVRLLDAPIGWQIVILVTCVEAFLQDVLQAAAVDPDLMSRSQIKASYSEIVTAKSLEDVLGELRSRWASSWLAGGGPSAWISTLEKMGAGGYESGLASTLETTLGNSACSRPSRWRC